MNGHYGIYGGQFVSETLMGRLCTNWNGNMKRRNAIRRFRRNSPDCSGIMWGGNPRSTLRAA